ncbi:uncharacterized protein LOC112000830 [Quercus suber]|uniref:PGG domain-containing protein n=1 Tax=Quercus suber TaxID=58331 RepID=A0AAW0IUZ8_QUESU|nr:uncharacterized protein LOC112000830 [Quercus suber]
MRKMLIRVRASKGSSITTDSSYAYYLRPPKCRRLEKIRTKYARQMTTISDDKRNALLVVAALLIAVTYQAALSPPGGLQETIKKPDKDCCDAPCAKWKTNADSWRTTQISTSQADGPDGYIGWMLSGTQAFLWACYIVSFVAITGYTYFWITLISIGSTLYLILLQVFSVWTRIRSRRHGLGLCGLPNPLQGKKIAKLGGWSCV